jgi:hypothetical protein
MTDERRAFALAKRALTTTRDDGLRRERRRSRSFGEPREMRVTAHAGSRAAFAIRALDARKKRFCPSAVVKDVYIGMSNGLDRHSTLRKLTPLRISMPAAHASSSRLRFAASVLVSRLSCAAFRRFSARFTVTAIR